MADQSRIPRNFNKFVMYLEQTSAYLLQKSPLPFTGFNWQRFHWTESELAMWQFFSKKASEYFSAYRNPSLRSTAIRDRLKNLRESTVQYNRKQCLLDRIASNPNQTVLNDFYVFNIRRGTSLEKIRRSRPQSPIDEKIFFFLKPIGGAILMCKCWTQSRSGRPHRHRLADSIQVAFKTRSPAPKSYLDCPEKEIFRTAKFFIHLPMEEIGETIGVFVRWYNTKYPHLAGPWSGLHVATVM